MYEFKYNDEHLPWMLEQVWEAKPNVQLYSELSEWEVSVLKPYLPENPRNVMDIGCGLGRAAIALHQYHYGRNVFYWLADADVEALPTINSGAFGAGELYNNLGLTTSFCLLNGMENFSTLDAVNGDWDVVPDGSLDLILSSYSLGVHVPIEWYMDRLYQKAAPNATLIFGIRENGYGDKSFSDRFVHVARNRIPQRGAFPQQDWLVLKEKK